MNIKSNIRKIRLFGLVTLSALTSGCDYLPEVITGRADPTAAKIQPAGPMTLDTTLDSTPPSPFGTPAAEPPKYSSSKLVNDSTSGYDNAVIQTGGSVDGNFGVPPSLEMTPSVKNQPASNQSTFTSNDSGLQVPPADANSGRSRPSSASVDGKIYIRSANLKFVHDLEIAAQADGLVLDLKADEGDILSKGDLLVQLDDRLANSELEVTQKELEAATEKAKDDSEILYSRAAFNVAEIDYTKTEELNSRGSETDSELRKKWLEKRRAELAITVAQLKSNQDKAAVEVSAAKRGAATVQVGLRKMMVPFDGIVAEKKKETHDWVRAGDVLLRLVSMEQMRVAGQVRVEDLQAAPHQLVNAPASIDIELFPGHRERVDGKVGFVSPVMEVSGAYRIWIQIPNKKANNEWLFREGMPATIEISTR